MNPVIITILTIIIIIAILFMFYITNYNKLLYYKKRVEHAESVILEELNVRYELVTKTRKTIEKNTKMDLDIYDNLDKSKSAQTNIVDYEKELTNAIQTIYLVTNDYPKLQEKKEFKKILRELNESDTKIDAAKAYYNDNNSNLISLIKSFPSNIIALIHKIKSKPFYEAKEVFTEKDDVI